MVSQKQAAWCFVMSGLTLLVGALCLALYDPPDALVGARLCALLAGAWAIAGLVGWAHRLPSKYARRERINYLAIHRPPGPYVPFPYYKWQCACGAINEPGRTSVNPDDTSCWFCGEEDPKTGRRRHP